VSAISDADLARVEAILREDIHWAITKGPGWDPSHGAQARFGVWAPMHDTFDAPASGVCGVCAIGAFVCHRQPPIQDSRNDVHSAAVALKVDEDWLSRLYYAVADAVHEDYELDEDDEREQVVSLAARLNAYADEVKAQYGAAK
jgi:hypothetical protein